ncbi:hypothetical protein SBA3_3880015 [Candidatus Sulfopaludibacter sp. SbA3]|nr:hypothetical protein SBA3_3880015 [Candidatus Sulfopaludibacter sp. SbA3]
MFVVCQLGADRPAKRDEKPAGNAGVLAAGCTRRPATRSPALPGRSTGFSTLLGWAFRAKLHEKPVTPAVLPPVALAGRRRDRRRCPVAQTLRVCRRRTACVSDLESGRVDYR